MKPLAKSVDYIRTYLGSIFSSDLHAKRVESLSHGVLGVMTSASLAVSAIGHAMAQARGVLDKHAIKQIDRLLSNQGVDPWTMFGPWVAEVVGERKAIVVAMDWTDFDADDQTTLVLSLVTSHGRATPLVWLRVPTEITASFQRRFQEAKGLSIEAVISKGALSVFKAELKDKRNHYEDLCLARLAEVLPEGVTVTILADRGFGDTKLFAYLTTLGFGHVIRFRGNIHVTAADGVKRPAADWVGKGGRARKLRDAEVTAAGHKVGAVVCVKAKGMKEAWCLAASDADLTAREITDLYAKRWTIDIDQSWRLSRLRVRGIWLGHRGRQASPRRRRGAHGLERGDGVRIGMHELGRASPDCRHEAAG
jgi:hypothetical protein